MILAVSISIAFFIAQSGVLENFITQSQTIHFLGSLIAGFFFTSVLTVGPAAVALGEIAQAGTPFLVALIGAAGSVIGDLILFRFVRDRITDDFLAFFERQKFARLKQIFHLAFFRWLTPVIGALLIASPLPDEIGLAMLGISKIKTLVFIPLSYAMNFIGILIIGEIARTIG